ncbi:hypothetical protein NB709_001101 [Xanthomonas sacchari]|uniref:hypothetical protein n=1 Tax=Xanthomonas sacchari TaxID=56458 RepID=UPI002435E8A4|nr:hypothetical protein [Xanthomonas sacchari]MCW0411225.1 hypothetical protein [Xanthomonas sacchari]
MPPSPLCEGERLLVSFPLCTVQTSIFDLAEQLNLPLHRWEEPGLGPTHGFGCRLDTGHFVVVEEHEHARAQLGIGATLYVEASQLIERGIDAVLSETIAGLSVPRQSVTWVQTEDAVEEAKRVVQYAIERNAKRESGN